MPKKKQRPLTLRQKEVLDYISDQMQLDGRPPTLREIGSHIKVGSTNAVRSILTALEKKGQILRRPYLSRGIELLKRPIPNKNVVRIPIVGRVAAGTPLLAIENLDGEIFIDRDMFKSDDGFALKVKGMSMIEAGIIDGDVVLTRPDLSCDPGSIVVAIIGEEATVKYYYPEKDRIRLEPANQHFGPILVEQGTPGFRIAGKVVGLYRRY